MEDFWGLNKMISENGGIEKFRCFAQMGFIEAVIPCFGLAMISGDKQTWVECCIDESRYKIEDDYKITLKSLDPRAHKEDYYQSDFMSLVKSGHILVKHDDNQHVEHVTWLEPLCNRAFIRNEADVVV